MYESKYKLTAADKVMECMSEAFSIAQDVRINCEREDLFDLAKKLRRQAVLCNRAIGAVINIIALADYDRRTPEPELIDLSKFVREIAETTHYIMRNSKMKFECVLQSEGIMVEVDRQRLTACVMNLITNAYQNAEQDEGALTVTVSSSGKEAIVSVSDNGYSMTDEELSKALDTDGEDGEGFAIIKKFCESVHGTPFFARFDGGFTAGIRIPCAGVYNDVLRSSAPVSDYPLNLTLAGSFLFKVNDAEPWY